MLDKIWHYGKRVDATHLYVKVSRRKPAVLVEIVNKPCTIEGAIGKILNDRNLMRVSRYRCEAHKRIHKFSFHSEVSFGFARFVGFDTEAEVIAFAQGLRYRL